MPVIFDSNVWIAMFNENDSHHEQAQHLFSANPVVVIPEYVILEVATVLQLRVSKQQANLFAKMVGSTLGFETLHASDEFFQQVVTVFQQQSQNFLLWIVHYWHWPTAYSPYI